jgi:hypothetical protein
MPFSGSLQWERQGREEKTREADAAVKEQATGESAEVPRNEQ